MQDYISECMRTCGPNVIRESNNGILNVECGLRELLFFRPAGRRRGGGGGGGVKEVRPRAPSQTVPRGLSLAL